MSRSEQFELLAVAINTGTNLPSVATPNGQAAFLFLLTSALAPLIRLSYGRMVWMALPYTLVLTLVGLLCIKITLVPCTQWLLQAGILAAHVEHITFYTALFVSMFQGNDYVAIFEPVLTRSRSVVVDGPDRLCAGNGRAVVSACDGAETLRTVYL